MSVYPARQLREEMAFIALHFHWGRHEVLSLEHAERRAWCREISAINRTLDGATPNPFEDFEE
ncbi:hypothetical protein B0G71_1440 [Paraburkholderia sp. BL27I4N3]|uniref:DUF6760 family protein n=1 Tax=Paraburkholderia sp. BL27I4N3 TaxID=1938805 RepID=UPI000E26A0E0|nr:DUF6760 family protein [Paraburkholderia sp. BL27I4N3]REE18424.1 hypothetical protein B0G71_1440 [Paraburkholderia sp. BL27I4N3]